MFLYYRFSIDDHQEHAVGLKKRFTYNLQFLFFVLLFPATYLQAEELLLLSQEFPPYTFQKNDQIVGINADIIARVLTEEKVDYRIERINWARAQRIVETTPNTALLSAGRSKVRENKYAWIGPLVSSTPYFFKLSSRDDIFVSSTEDLQLYRIALTRRSVFVDILESIGLTRKKNLVMVSDASDIYKFLFHDKADLLIGSDLTTPYNLQKLGYELAAIEPTFELKIAGVRNYLAVNKDFSPEVIERCNARVRNMWDDGTVAQIIEDYRL